MALPLESQLNEDTGPVSEKMFREINGAQTPNAVEIAATLPEGQRAQLAVFCYRKRHLHDLGLRIASTCGLNALLQAAGTGGEVIFKQSRDPDATLAKETVPASHASRPITLATCVRQIDLGSDDEDDDDDVED